MGLDIYVGTLTRYYSGQWETIAAQTAREQGWSFKTVRPDNPDDAVTDPAQLAPAVQSWQAATSEALGDNLSEPLDWQEGMTPPYFTDKPDWDGLGGVLLWAAYLEQPGLQRPKRYTKDWEHDPAFAASTAESFQSPYVRNFDERALAAGHR